MRLWLYKQVIRSILDLLALSLEEGKVYAAVIIERRFFCSLRFQNTCIYRNACSATGGPTTHPTAATGKAHAEDLPPPAPSKQGVLVRMPDDELAVAIEILPQTQAEMEAHEGRAAFNGHEFTSNDSHKLEV